MVKTGQGDDAGAGRRGLLLDYLRHLLVSPVTITGAEAWRKESTFVSEETIVWFPKILLVTGGAVEYRIDGRAYAIAAGTMLYRPAWTRSHWRSVMKRPLELAWCEFDLPTAGAGGAGLIWREPLAVTVADAKLERVALGRIVRLYEEGSGGAILEAAGELKAVLARLFAAAARESGGEGAAVVRRSAAEGAVDRALDYLGDRFASADVLEGLHERVGLGVNRFRTAFKARMGLSPQQYVLYLRMRAARYYLTDARMAVKQVAAAVGYEDPLYFSRAYWKFWGHRPTEDRQASATGARPRVPYNGSSFTTKRPATAGKLRDEDARRED